MRDASRGAHYKRIPRSRRQTGLDIPPPESNVRARRRTTFEFEPARHLVIPRGEESTTREMKQQHLALGI